MKFRVYPKGEGFLAVEADGFNIDNTLVIFYNEKLIEENGVYDTKNVPVAVFNLNNVNGVLAVDV